MSETKNEWKNISAERMADIEKKRAEAKAKGPLVRDPKGTYGIVCRACIKPNTVTATFCTGCSFPCVEWDIERLPDNIFLMLINGQDIGTTVCYRDNEILVIDDKYPVSDNHVCVIPVQVYEDITVLDGSHVGLVEKLYECGKQQLLKRNLPFLKDQDFDSLVSAGYNFPVSVKHLHIHMILPPFKHNKILQYPRWHSHEKVVNDLKQFGKVRLYANFSNDQEGQQVYDRAMANQTKVKALLTNA